MVTPFDDNGALDLDGAVRLARWLVEQGNDGLVVCGTTGESPTLSDDEKIELWRTVAEAVTVPVIAGSTSNDTAHSIELTKAAEASGVTAILAQTPYYNRPSQAGIEAHFRSIAGATALPVLLYDIPVRTGRKINHETLVRLATDVENIVGVKDAAGDPVASARLLAEAPSDFDLYSGDDALTLPLLAIGAVGVIAVASHWAAPHFQDMVEAFARGDARAALESHRRLLSSFAYETTDTNPYPVPAKAMMRLLGQPAGHCRLPHVEVASDELLAEARALVAELGLSVA